MRWDGNKKPKNKSYHPFQPHFDMFSFMLQNQISMLATSRVDATLTPKPPFL